MTRIDDPCAHDSCITCADTAVAVTVLELLDDALALVEVGEGRRETVSVGLVRADAGDTVLVHAGEAIAVLPRPSGASVISESEG
ncbi:HypC/HybG/HupF family hydrogenase formation chaperone [Actinospica durhamensis]|uniref:HypC/HybG/HupF family hydrogenase formation chaperone n=1 Tax=Actinospica durhamensis TaxID=1508375 RepID=A0A941ERA1_9ACTN|nr:HypC/HybG/HupF family hydrogenase formation chaperone [Actinospica durhamensis]MBR7835656.1 HypC/HybG/HupF family hydrogenase formation chaperone [Actinospica durhamensis]